MDIRGFKALRPKADFVKDFSTLPYDVVSDTQVKTAIQNNTNLFFKVIKTDSLYDENIYEKAKENLEQLKKENLLIQDEKKSFYIYQEIFKDINQTGIVATINIDEYIKGNVKKHEKTLKEKEIDRINNFYTCKANTEPVFLFQNRNAEIEKIIYNTKLTKQKEYDFISEDNVRHILWKIDDETVVNKLESLFKKVNSLYIADGHHRTASSIDVALKIRQENPAYDKNSEFNYFMAVIFFEDELKILPYNRIIKNLEKYDIENILKEIKANFKVQLYDKVTFPTEKHSFTMILNNKIYKLTANKSIIDEKDPINSLDTIILHKNIIEPLFKITDIKNEDDIEFVGGTNALKNIDELKNGNIVFLMYPTQIEQIKNISDIDAIMPPKSTWFEPKLRSGLFIHEF